MSKVKENPMSKKEAAVAVVENIFDPDHYRAICEHNQHVMAADKAWEQSKTRTAELKKTRDELHEQQTTLIATKAVAPLFDRDEDDDEDERA